MVAAAARRHGSRQLCAQPGVLNDSRRYIFATERGTGTVHKHLNPDIPPLTASSSACSSLIQVSLLAALSSLDRGLAANAREAAEVDELCSQLEGLGGPVALAAPAAGGQQGSAAASSSSGSSAPSDLLAGTWRLVYSSGFNSGSLGGRRPGPPAAGFPATLGQVYQLLLSPPPPLAALGSLGGLLGEGLGGLAGALPQGPLRDAVAPLAGALAGSARVPAPDAERESPAARLTLRHDYEVTPPCGVRICYEETYGELVGSDLFAPLPRLEAPQLPEPLRPPKFLRSASFDVTYLDSTGLRITRGDRGELRVYLRDSDPAPSGGGRGGGGGSRAAMDLDYDD
eukprot:XP_001702245.1 plastid lipid associated protein [Chlamydomonas reinhardtii]